MLRKARFSTQCDVIFLVRLEENLKLITLGSERGYLTAFLPKWDGLQNYGISHKQSRINYTSIQLYCRQWRT